MDVSGDLASHTKRPLSPGRIPGPLAPATKRTRVAGSKNLKNHEVALIHQHLLRRNKVHKDTIFITHGVQRDFQNVRRKIRRLNDAQLKPLEGILPSHIELRTPSPEPASRVQIDLPDAESNSELQAPSSAPARILSSEPAPRVQIDLLDIESNSEQQTPSLSPARTPFPQPAPRVQIDLIDAESNLEYSTQRSEETPLSMSPRSSYAMSDSDRDEMTSENEEDDIEKAGNAALSDLPASEIFIVFRGPNWRQPKPSSVSIHMPPLGMVVVQQKDCLQDFVDRLYSLGYPGPRLSHLEMVLKLIHGGHVSTSYFLETVYDSLDRRAAEIIEWLSGEIQFSENGARALGTAVCRNDFKVVDILLKNYVDINGNVSGPHSDITPDCRCQVSILHYTQLQRSNEFQGPGASDEMVAYLLSQGAEDPAGLDRCLLDLLACVLRQQDTLESAFLPLVQSVVRRMHKFTDIMSNTETILETCIREWEFESYLQADRFQVVVEYLLDQGAQASSGSPLAALIFKNGPVSLLPRLLAKTENVNTYCNSVTPNDRFPNSTIIPPPYHTIRCINPIQAAALRGDTHTIDLLLRNGADINCPARGSCGVTALQAMCWSLRWPSDWHLVFRLLDKEPDVNAAPAWNLGLTALQVAAFKGHVNVARLLILRGADVNAPACKYGGGTALAMAARRGHPDMVEFLLRKGARLPPAGVKVCSLGVAYEDHALISNLLGISSAELRARFGHNGIPTRDYHEYEAEWADDPSYNK